jgi:hypothetical protein
MVIIDWIRLVAHLSQASVIATVEPKSFGFRFLFCIATMNDSFTSKNNTPAKHVTLLQHFETQPTRLQGIKASKWLQGVEGKSGPIRH